MNSNLKNNSDLSKSGSYKTMQEFGENFIEKLPKHFANLKIPVREINGDTKIDYMNIAIDDVSNDVC